MILCRICFGATRCILNLGVAKATSWGLSFHGNAYEFKALATRWYGSSEISSGLSEIELSLHLDRPSVGTLEVIAVDESDLLEGLPVSLRSLWLSKDERNILVNWIRDTLRHLDVQVLMLGHFISSSDLVYHLLRL